MMEEHGPTNPLLQSWDAHESARKGVIFKKVGVSAKTSLKAISKTLTDQKQFFQGNFSRKFRDI